MITIGRLTGLDRVRDALIARVQALTGAAVARIRPSPDARADGGSNLAVLADLGRRFPGLTTPGLDTARAGRDAAVMAWRAGYRTFRELALHAATGAARSIATRLRSGRYLTNTTRTLAIKAARAQPQVPGVATRQLSDSLDNASVEID